jgi:mono/diheme cytochrome c family protein
MLAAGCSDRGSPPLISPPPPTISYRDDIQPIFDARCTVCHFTGGFADLSLLAGASYHDLVNVQASGYNAIRIVPGDPEDSVLYNKVTNTGLYGGIMPAVGPPLTDPQIAAIRTWIEEGARDN